MKAAIYARYSSRLQRPVSIDDQVSLCRDAAPRFGCEIIEDHVYADREISGSEEHREAYEQMMAAARARALEAILVESQDRLWRNQAEMHHALRRLRFWGVKVFSVSTATELTSKAGGLLASVMGWKDETYLEDLREKTHRGLAGQARRGFNAGGRAFGYRTEPVTDPTRVDAHGQAHILGYRLVVYPPEAMIVLRSFEVYAAGWSERRIGRQFNAESLLSPRGGSWTWTALHGSPRLGTGILNNRLYIGEVIWNKFRWEKDPETGKRVPRLRPREEWIVRKDESLRIVPQDLWDRVKRRQQAASERVRMQSHAGGRTPKYLFSGLLICSVCGAHFIMRDGTRYACSYHVNRGPEICSNCLTVSRQVVEDRMVRAIRQRLFAPEAIAYVTQRMNEELQAQERERRLAFRDRRQLENDFQEAMAELDHIREAIRRGLLSDLTRQMLEEAEGRVRHLRAQLEAPDWADLHALRVLPQVVAQRLEELERVLKRDVDLAREALRDILGPITLRPTPAGLVAEFRGNLRGLLALGEPAPVLETVVAGAGFEPATFGL